MQRFLPLVIVLALFAVFLRMMTLEDRNPNEIKSVMIGKPVPEFTLPGLLRREAAITDEFFKSGQPVLVNFFASWCVPCRAEHEKLMQLANEHGATIVGVAYKDEPSAALGFLDELGNPYQRTAVDRDGRLAIDFGVTGVPETFVIDGDGNITYRHWGPIVGDGLEAKVLPAFEAAQ
ncbi:DsbE family thiol:disulfide interchange protein [Kordiimonas aestuarii]|uniref:DsbE family thiol:disulfide interchange protein n=1 Tax=Kordiimonas aestuarii TaxID=1005925 RepID=UPI0021D16259|nr:DsbE family thiol:disulfide interchange protein [Kordiimonas aestuarii]